MLTYRKVGGLHFVRVGRFGFSFYWSKRQRVQAKPLEPIILAEDGWPVEWADFELPNWS